MNPRRMLVGLAAFTLSVLGGYSIGRASSPFSEGQDPPTNYSGTISLDGVPLSGSHQVAMNLWQASDTTNAANRVCAGTPVAVNFDAGNFQMTLDATCADAFARYSVLWTEFVVDGTSFQLQPVSAVPYALRSLQAPTNGSRLAQERTTTYGADGFHGDITYGLIHDTQRNEVCDAKATASGSDGGAPIFRCLPNVFTGSEANLTWIFSDSQCTQPLPTGPGIHYYSGSGTPPPANYVGQLDAAGSLTAVFGLTATPLSTYVFSPGFGCNPNILSPVMQGTWGAQVPLTDFVELQGLTE